MVAALKQNLAESQKRLRQYEWIETTAISLKGEEKSRKQQRVYYGADGKLTKLPIGEPQPQAAQGGGGRRGGRLKEKIVENKKDEMQEYMERAATLIHMYVPPSSRADPEGEGRGQHAAAPAAAGDDARRVPELRSAERPDGDRRGREGRCCLSALSVATYLDKPEDAVTLDVRFGALADGTSYNAQIAFEAKAKNIRVVVENSGHRPLAK